MLRSITSQFIDEVLANVLLHRYLWHRRAAPVRGPLPAECPSLFSGELAEFYSPAPTPTELAQQAILVRETPDTAIWDYRLPSESATGWHASDLVWCRHWKSRHNDQGVTLVGVDGIVQMGNRWFRRLSEVLNPRGIDVLAMDAPFNFRRTPRGYRPGQLIVNGDLSHQLAVTRQAVLDLWRVIASLQRAGRRVGLMGVSYGGWLALMTSLLAENLDFLIAVAPPVDIHAMLLKRGGTMIRGVRRGIGYQKIESERIAHIARPLAPWDWPPRLSGSRIRLHAGQYDRLVALPSIERLSRHWNAELTLHKAAHYQIALSTSILPQVADQVLALTNTTSEPRTP